MVVHRLHYTKIGLVSVLFKNCACMLRIYTSVCGIGYQRLFVGIESSSVIVRIIVPGIDFLHSDEEHGLFAKQR